MSEASLSGNTILQCDDKWQLTLGIHQEDGKEGGAWSKEAAAQLKAIAAVL